MGAPVIAQGKYGRPRHFFHFGAKGHTKHIRPVQCGNDLGMAGDEIIGAQPHHRPDPLHQPQPAVFQQSLGDPAAQLRKPAAIQRIQRKMPRPQIRGMRPFISLRLSDTRKVICIFRHGTDALCKGPQATTRPT